MNTGTNTNTSVATTTVTTTTHQKIGGRYGKEMMSYAEWLVSRAGMSVAEADNEAMGCLSDAGRLESIDSSFTFGKTDKDGNVKLKDLGGVAKSKLTKRLQHYRGYKAIVSAEADGLFAKTVKLTLD
jgi:hypothetical protein